MTASSERNVIASCITAYLRDHLQVNEQEIERDASFSEIGLTSLQLVGLTAHLAEVLGRTLSPTLGWEYRTISEMAGYLAGDAGFKMEQRHGDSDPSSEEQIAIIGMSCRFPGAPDLPSFWNLCWEALDSITEVPPARWDVNRYYDPDPSTPGKTYSRFGGFLEGLDMFDAAFFKISPREAVHLDPRQRLIMETSWEALEDAGIPPLVLAGGNTGVFVSTLSDDYGRLVFGEQERIEPYSGTGTAHSVIANRVSYFLDLHGPSLTLDTACSGALVALHIACRSLRSKECDLALTGGVNVILSPDSTLFFSRAGALSKQGRCKTFDTSADGFVRSEGAGVVVLKRVSDAVRDGDRIYAVVCGSAVNQDGRTNGMMAPSVTAQEAVLRQAYANAGVSPGAVQYVELHGTGTRLGDPIEAEALGRVLQQGRSAKLPCLVGSVKSNIGHTEAAAGLAGIIKTALAIEHRALPRSIHFSEINPLIPIERLPFRVATQSGEWPDPSRRLFAGVSSFGFGGTNAHVVLGAAPAAGTLDSPEEPHDLCVPLFLSAQTGEALRSLAKRYAENLETGSTSYSAVARSAAQQRSALNERLSVHVDSKQAAIDELTLFARGERSPHIVSDSVPTHPQRLAFVYSGQGSHWVGMARGLMSWDAFAEIMRQCDAFSLRHAGISLLSEIFDYGTPSKLDRTDIAQLSIFAVQASLTVLLRSFGITPNVVIGQSLGEVAAAHASGALSLEDAFLVAFERGRLMRRVEGSGRTAQIGLACDEVRELLEPWEGRVSIAGSSSPKSTVIAGDPESINNLVSRLEDEGIFARVLRGVEVAFHSNHMDPLREGLVEALKSIRPNVAEIPFFSSVDAEYRNGLHLDAAYWGDNLRQPFQFASSVGSLLEEGISTFVELAPHAVLGSSIMECCAEQTNDCAVIPTLRRGQDARHVAAEVCGHLFLRGYQPRPFPPAPRKVLSLPTYQWQRDRYWIQKETGGDRKRAVHHPFLGECVHVSVPPYPHVWEIDLAQDSPRFLSDHKVFGKTVFPGSGYIEMAVAAVSHLHPDSNIVLEDIEFAKGMVIPAGGTIRVQTSVVPQRTSAGKFEISNLGSVTQGGGVENDYTLCASGKFFARSASEYELRNVEDIALRCAAHVSSEHHYRTMSEHGLDYGPAFKALKEIRTGAGEALAEMDLSESVASELGRYKLHPACLDALFQLVAPLLAHEETQTSYLPIGISQFEIFPRASVPVWGRVTSIDGALGDRTVASDLELLSGDGAVICRVQGLTLRRVDGGQHPQIAMDASHVLYEQVWEEAPVDSVAERGTVAEPFRVCVTSGNSVAYALQSVWSQKNVDFVTVTPGPQYGCSGDSYTVRPDNADDYLSVLSDLRESGVSGEIAVINLLAMDERFQGEGSEDGRCGVIKGLISMKVTSLCFVTGEHRQLQIVRCQRMGSTRPWCWE
jgi:myxalamid-type polyketide synthase MxaE and MxaD